MIQRLRRSTGLLSLSWGLIDQTFSSATNFGLAVIAGQVGGPGGLGVVYIGFSAYLVALTMQRALVTDPLIVATAAQRPVDRLAAAQAALGVVIGAGAVWTALLAIIGLLLPTAIGRGLLIFTPWLIGSLLQDYWRALLFRDGRGRAAAMNDGVWAAVMALSVPLLLFSHSPWMVVLPWGAGALAGGLLGFVQTGLRPSTPGPSARWWRADAWRLARWFGPESVLLIVQMQLVVFALVAILGTADVGGLRAVQAVFAPMTLLAQAIGLPGLPMLTRMAATSRRVATTWALRLGGLGVALVLVYLAILLLLPRHLIGVVFGSSFDRFDNLILPTGVTQVLGAGGLGLALLVKAEGRVRALLLNRAIATIASIVLAIVLAVVGGITAATWGIAAAAAVAAVTIAVIALRPTR